MIEPSNYREQQLSHLKPYNSKHPMRVMQNTEMRSPFDALHKKEKILMPIFEQQKQEKSVTWVDATTSLFKNFFLYEVKFSMTKFSVFSLIFGFMFLGILFFLAGFITGLYVYESKNNITRAKQTVQSLQKNFNDFNQNYQNFKNDPLNQQAVD